MDMYEEIAGILAADLGLESSWKRVLSYIQVSPFQNFVKRNWTGDFTSLSKCHGKIPGLSITIPMCHGTPGPVA